MFGQPQHPEFPTHAAGTGAELIPMRVWMGRNMMQFEARALRNRFEIDLDPAHMTHELPGAGKMPPLLAGRNSPRCIALHGVAPTEFQVAGNGREPAPDALGICHGLPQIGDVGVVNARCDQVLGGLPVIFNVADLAVNSTQMGGNIERHEFLQR